MAITAGTLTGYTGQVDTTQATQIARFSITLTGNYGSSGSHGDTLDFGKVYGIQSQAVPIRVFVYQQPASGTAPGNCTAIFCPGTTIHNGVVSFFNAGTELTGGSAYTGATAAAVWVVEAVFPVGY
jgi:hypothetical protein